MGVSGPKGTMPPDLLDKLRRVRARACVSTASTSPIRRSMAAAVMIGGPGDKDSLDPSSPEFQAAQEACQSIMPDGGPGFSVGGATDKGPSTTTGG